MNLKEKITDLLFEVVHINFSPKDVVKKILKMNDDYTVDFTDWCEEHYFPSSVKGVWFDKPDFDNAKRFLTRELLQIYKNDYENKTIRGRIFN